MLQLSRMVLAASLGVALNLYTVGGAVAAQEVTGAGSTFIYPVLFKWATDYDHKTGIKVNYQSVGSGAGLAQIKDGAVDFGATDMPLKSSDLQTLGLQQFPSVIGGVVPVINIPSIKPGTLRFSGPVLAAIYLGNIKKWNDPALSALNPGLKLPDSNITVVYRSDDSGTTFNWASYLSKVSAEWQNKVGSGTSLKWPVGIGSKGSEGVASYVKKMPNSIGYVEYAYIKQQNLNYGILRNAAGNYITPSTDSFQAAAATADWKDTKDFDLSLLDAPGDKAYPITAATFILLYKHPKDADRQKTVQDFFQWTLQSGEEQARSLDFAPLPADLKRIIERSWEGAPTAP
ncbi:MULTISPECIES: phosphate ABC transporter substrate-binding protein PstS [unclassified Pseudomonas]|uniref:phosphate ABC transporter substrate-binding protein PstS n=1 Tax=unclassified Pseudomonas TaxID=196821 RepID=UPI002115B083|nr:MULTISPECIES: phosphate ABC transporter substrate-binding protein PstS [unclassified Pseudomonas]